MSAKNRSWSSGGRLDLDRIAADLAAADAATACRALDRLGPRLHRLREPEHHRAIEMVCSLLYIDAIDRPDFEEVLQRAMDVLADQGARVIPALLDQMRGSDIKSHTYLARILAMMGDPALPRLRNAIATADDPYVRTFALYALGKMTCRSVARALPEVIGSLMHPDREVRDSAARTLGKIATVVPRRLLTPRRRREMFETLVRAVRDVQPAVRAKAMRSLGKMAAAGLLNGRQRSALETSARAALGEADVYAWDNAYIVRREARETLDRLASGPAAPAARPRRTPRPTASF